MERWLACAVLAAAVGLSACGDSSDMKSKTSGSASAPTTQPTQTSGPTATTGQKAAYIKRVDALCHGANVELRPIRQTFQTATQRRDIDAAVAALTKITDAVDERFREIKAVPPPPQGPPSAYFDRVGEQIDTYHELRDALDRRNINQFRRLATLIRQQQPAVRAAAASYGLKSCGTGS
jgi:hypothetical protein